MKNKFFIKHFYPPLAQRGILNVGLVDPQLINFKRKISIIKRGGNKEIKSRFLKNCISLMVIKKL